MNPIRHFKSTCAVLTAAITLGIPAAHATDPPPNQTCVQQCTGWANGHPLDTCAPDLSNCTTPAPLPPGDPQPWYDGHPTTSYTRTVTAEQTHVAPKASPSPVLTYEQGLCLQLQAAKPWIEWGCGR